MTKKKDEINIRSSAAEYLTYVASVGNQQDSIEMRYEDENIWLTQKMMATLYDVGLPTINEHIKKIYADSELEETATIRNFRIVQTEGSRQVTRDTKHYNLQMIIAVGFKVNSERAVQFRKWVNQIAKDYTIKGWVMDDERLKRGTYLTEKYFDEQLERIREIRASKRKFYQKITDLYATAIDYDKNSATTRRFYATVQNKMHYAVHGHTAAELIVERADHTKEHMGLTTWADAPDGKIKKSDVTVAKNYLSQDEMKQLNRMVTAYLDFAENMTLRHIPLTMQDFEKMSLVQDAVNAMCETLETKKTFQTYASELARLFRYADRDDVDDAVRARKNAILAIYEGLQQKRKHADNTDLMVQINGIVNEYIHVEKPDQEAVPSRQFDISKIDFDPLSREFAHTRRKNLLLRDLDELVNQQLAKMLFANPQRMDYYDRYQEIIDAYNAEQNRATIEKTFMDLMELASSLDTEQQRYVREGFSSDEELSVYDLLFSENLTKQEIETIKKVSVDLLTKIKQQIAKLDHWTDKQETKAIVDNLIRNTLWQELPNSYDVSDIQTYQKKIYEYVYMRYPEVA